MSTSPPVCLGCARELFPIEYKPGTDQPKICRRCLKTMTPAEIALRYENARIIYLLNAADINSEHRDSEESAISRLARAIERWLAEYRAEQRRQNQGDDGSPPEKI